MKAFSASIVFLFVLLVAVQLPGRSQNTIASESAGNLQLVKPVSSGDQQHDAVNRILADPVQVQVLDSLSHPVAGVRVYFRILYQPRKSDGFRILKEEGLTDSSGMARTSVQLGNQPGAYEMAARIESSVDKDFQVFTFYARKANWLMMLIFGLLGGLGLFLLGMEFMSEGMKKSAGDRLRSILGNLTRNRFLALGLGTFVTMVIQSSSAVSVMLVGFVNSKLMKFRRTIAIILGANIGTTITAQLIAFKVTDYALLMIALGFGMVYFLKKQGLKYLGQSILGFGVLFYGMHVMSDAMYPLQTYAPIRELLLELENPLLGILVGALFTALLQSSSAFIGILIVMAGQGLLTLEAGIALLLGSNIGTSITAILASLRTSREARKVALANVLVNTIGVLVFVSWIPAFSKLMAGAETIPRQLANAHTFFNVAMAILLLPVTGLLARIIDWILPERPPKKEAGFSVQFLDEKLLNTPVLGLNLAKEEALRIAGITQDMLSDMLIPFLLKDDALIDEVMDKGKLVAFLSDKVNLYLIRITRQSIESERANEAFQIMYSVKELEQISRSCTSLLENKAATWIKGTVKFSEEGKKELVAYHLKIQKQLSRAIEVFRDLNLEKARIMKEKHKEYRILAADLEKQHYERLRDEAKELESEGDTHMGIMTHLRTMMSHATNIGRILLQWRSEMEE